ncbi:DNA sulfur modification protein DndD [Brevundimonas variabilis]|uniref:DNA sulfur modification protein DndD n=1 Tax=Brevundimonas variabilis TaxID=74312 RepID=A0A7W9FF51_9CAUL|nr:DNA sulfur modification protein DndD [Brevundimonas variabilis]MBB5747057.1 DNA sulfur modification protein DndD [Brevundimonas variabilis]
MILDELVLHDFGVYGGRQAITLTPMSRDKPIILFGGLNGGGKTTLLDALQLAFYGARADCAGRADLAYDEYLRRSVHRQHGASDASVEVAFRYTIDGETQSWRLTRAWRNGDNTREQFQVLRDGKLDKAASEHWGAQVEDLLPARIAPLFLFDGEKVEGYADLNEAPGLIRTAIQNLLGLDIVERLAADLNALERRHRGDLKTPAEAEALTSLRADIDRLTADRVRVNQASASQAVEVDNLVKEVKLLDARYEREGGALFQDRSRLEAELAVSERALEALRRSLRDAAAGSTPLKLISGLLGEVALRASDEEAARRSETTAGVMADEHAALIAHPALEALPSEARKALEAFAQDRREQLDRAAAMPRVLNLDAAGLAALDALTTGEELEAATRQSADLLTQTRQMRETVEHLRGLLASVPAEASVGDLISARDAARDQHRIAAFEAGRLEEEKQRLEREIQSLRDREAKLLEVTARAHFEQEDIGRILNHSGRVRDTLGRFREAVIHRHVTRIEQLVLDSFQQLVRKRDLVRGLRIDPQTFMLELTGPRGEIITAERLSAGERQLLAIAMLWGLGRASGRPLPMVIDTPLGRLDSEHRARLVANYFPNASHQVMLLSTDEEITRDHYEALKPSVGRTYRLRYDEDEARTVVEDGYFAAEAA